MRQWIKVAIVVSVWVAATEFSRGATNTLVSSGSTWKYLDNGSDQGTAWRAPGFSDASWASGPAQLGYGDGDEATVVSFGPNGANKYITTYFRQSFTVADPAAYTNLALTLLRDDGGVVYLNGAEIFRTPNMPATPVAFNTVTVGTAPPDNTIDQATVNSGLGLLVAGVNVIAVEIHQQSTNSSDISFDLQLVASDAGAANVPPTVNISGPADGATFNAPTNILVQANASDPDGSVSKVEFFRSGTKVGEDTAGPTWTLDWTNALVGTFQLTAMATDNLGATTLSAPISVTFTGAAPATLIAAGSVWRFLDTGDNLTGTPWNTVGFDDSGWLSGPAQLGYGDGDEVTVVNGVYPGGQRIITTYFRRTFNVADPSAYSFLVSRLLRDDGAVVYVNGVEALRDNMPAGPIDANTVALTAVGGAAESTLYFTNTLPSSLLVAGQNVVAVEIHQQGPSSSDISFDLELIGNTGAIVNNPPTVGIASPANNATYTEPATITLSANASDGDGSVAKVEFFSNGGKIGEDTGAPFSFGWSGVPVGSYALTAIATDNLGASATSGVVNVVVTASTAPTLVSKTPAPGTLGSLTQVTVQFSEPVDGVNASDLLVNGVPASSVVGSNATYTFSFPQPPEGGVAVGFAANHGIVDRELPPKAFDATAPGSSWMYTLVDNVAPTVVKIDPAPGATLRSLTSIEVTFSEPVGGINPTDLRINGRGATDVGGSGAGPFKFTVTQPATNGPVTVAWTNNHGIRDFAAAQNPFAGGSWVYTLATNTIQTNILISEIMFHPPHNDAAFVPEPLAEEYIELFNRGTNAVNLTGWRLKGGVEFTIPAVTLASNRYLVVAANVQVFTNKYPGVTNVVGGWIGRLSDSDDGLNLEDALGQQMDSVHYADSGDWALRRILPDQTAGRPSMEWLSDADGLGKSLELINPRLPNQYGQNWAFSTIDNGTPGRTNSVVATNIPPIILDVTHSPAVPRSTNSVTILARLVDELSTGRTATLFWRIGSGSFTQAPMFDDGAHNDGLANDGVFAAILPAQSNLAVVEYYVQASDSGSRTRTWPGPIDTSGTQGANALFQFDDEDYTGTQPIYRLIMTEVDNQALADLNNTNPGSNQRFNASFVTRDGIEDRVVYQAGIRLRGAGSRGAQPPNLRVQFPGDAKWKGLTAINLNTLYTHSQLIGSILSRKSGLTSEEAIAVQVRRGGTNAASSGSPQFGLHIFLESRGSDWAANHFPLDPNGNVYTATRPNAGLIPVNPPTPANLEANGYQKDTNKSDNDYSDVANLLNVLNNTPDAQYPSAVRETVNAEEWLRYMAVLSLLGYGETAIGSDGSPDDYTLYRGLNDTRFQFIPHDHDTDMGQGDGSRQGPFNSIFRAADGNGVVNRFLRNPEFVPLYYKELKFQLEHTFSLAEWTRTLDQAYAGFPVSSQTILNMKDWLTNRYNNVWTQIQTNFVISLPALSQQSGYYRTTASPVALNGLADVVDTRFVKVNGQFASWSAVAGTWSADVNLQPGINRVTVQTTDGSGKLLREGSLEIWYDDGTLQNVSGVIAANTVWSPASGPYNVTANLTVNSGVTLTIQPGTTVYLGSGVNITVANGGQLLAEGTAGARIRFTRTPGAATTWGGITVNGGVGSPETRITYADFEFNGATAIHSAAGTVFLDHLAFGNTAQQYVSLDDSSFVVSHCVFPTATAQFELVHGTGGIKSGGRGLFLRNYFGVPIGYNDVVDFTGGNRPGQPIVQFIGNVFTGASDDILDLDGTDAWIEGNIFLHSHKNGSPDSSSAISGGLTGSDRSELTIIGNIIYDCDQVANAKEGNFYSLINNTLVRITKQGGTDTNSTVALMADVGTAEGAGMYLEGNIIYDAEKLVFGRTNSVVTYTNNIITLLQGAPWSGPGGNNSNADPLFQRVPLLAETAFTSWEQAQVMWSWLSLKPGSPGIGTGPNGRDKGGVIPFGASISGEPAGTTPQTTATLTVGVNRTGSGIPTSGFPNGSGFTHYRSRLDGGAWGAETPINTPISLSSLSAGPHRVEVSGRFDSGLYQDDPALGEDATVTASRTWFVGTGGSTVRINEVLARNDAAVPVGTKFPDLIELYNAGTTSVPLAGVGVTDEADNPFKFSFPAGTTLGAGQYLILYADGDSTPPGHHLGFSIKQEGDEVFLTAPDGRLIDSVVFGLQVADRSIGRGADGAWVLCQPTLGANNVAARIGDPRTLRINEWLASGLTPYPDDFIELFNPDALPVSLGELFLTDMPTGASFLHDITPLSFIPGGGYAVFIADGNAGAGANHVNFGLNAENGLIALVAADGSLIDCIYYGPQTTDVSMGRQPNGSVNYGFFAPPTPGSPNPAIIPPGGTVTINEVLAQNSLKRAADNTTPDWVELYNPTGSAIDVSDMSLTDDSASPRRYVFSPGMSIPALGFLTIRCDADIPAGTNNTGFGLKQTGQALYLFDKLANGGGQLSAVSFGVQAADFSIGRVPDGSTNWVLCAEKIGLPNVAAVLGSTAGLKVNEWMANPRPGDDDWFEIFNPNAQPVALGGLHLSDNLGSLTKHKIAPLSFIGIGGWAYQRFVADSDLAAGPDHVGFGLSGSGEQLGISSAAGVLIDGVGFGTQIEDVSQGRLPDGSANIISFPVTASPGDPNYLLLTNVVISEALSHTDPPLEDSIELQNLSGAQVNIGGWYLSNAKHDLRRFRIPDGTTISAGSFKVFYQYQFGETNENAPAVPPLFNLDSAHDDEIYLAQATNDMFTGYRAQVSFGAAENGVSFGRFVTSVGADFTAMSARTFGEDAPDSLGEFRLGTGQTNAYPRVGPVVITEIMYHPTDSGTNDNVIDEFIELQNFSSLAVPLYDVAHMTNTWKLKDAVTFSFPQNTSIAGNGFLIIVSFDPANTTQLNAFRSKYNVQAGTPIVGPYSGKLDNASDSVELAKPDAPQTGGVDTGFVPYILVDKVKYSDLPPWPSCFPLGPNCGPDGGGQSIQRINLNEYGNDPINWQAGSPNPGPQGSPLDSDGDGMTDSWELTYFGSLSRGGSGDFDGDGMTDLEEFMAGTAPNDPNSLLRLLVSNSGGALLQFSAAANLAYVVEYKNALVPGAWTTLQNVPAGSARVVQVADPFPGATRFYRVRTQ